MLAPMKNQFAPVMSVLTLALAIASSTFGAAADRVADLSEKNSRKMLPFYKELHRTPELSGEEKETAKKVAAEMRAMGLEVQEGIGGYGVVGILRNGNGPTTWLRAELDALPVEEMTGAEFKSQTPGKMHACGHDFHMAAMLGAAQTLIDTKANWKGTIVLIGQPSEEKGNGAKAMLKDGLVKKIPKPDQILGLHSIGSYKKGTVGITPGYAAANVDSVDVIFKGKGTHGSKPDFGIDPFIMAAEFTLKMQTLMGRERAANKPAVISVGSIHGGTKHNIIPDEVKLQLTVRTYDPALRALLKKRIVEIARGIAKTNNGPDPDVSFPEDADAMYNDPKLAQQMNKLFTEKFGKDAVIEPEPTMGGEDFGQFGIATKAPSLMLWIGQRNESTKVTDAPVNHSARYLPDYAKTAPLAIRTLTAAVLEWHGQTEKMSQQASQ